METSALCNHRQQFSTAFPRTIRWFLVIGGQVHLKSRTRQWPDRRRGCSACCIVNLSFLRINLEHTGLRTRPKYPTHPSFLTVVLRRGLVSYCSTFNNLVLGQQFAGHPCYSIFVFLSASRFPWRDSSFSSSIKRKDHNPLATVTRAGLN